MTLGPLGSELQEILKTLPQDFRPEPEHWDDLNFLEKEHYLEHRFSFSVLNFGSCAIFTRDLSQAEKKMNVVTSYLIPESPQL